MSCNFHRNLVAWDIEVLPCLNYLLHSLIKIKYNESESKKQYVTYLRNYKLCSRKFPQALVERQIRRHYFYMLNKVFDVASKKC